MPSEIGGRLKRRIAVVTSNRADYGLLYWPMRRIAASKNFELALLVTGSHLVHSFGMTVNQIEADGFPIACRVPVLLAGDDSVNAAKAFGLTAIGLADGFASVAPDLIVLLGDRYEILAAGAAAHLMRIPIAHIAGGDVTEGAFDDASRHALTKLAHLHFVTNDGSGARLRQMGEAADRIHVVGSPGIDTIVNSSRPGREEFFSKIGLDPTKKFLLVTFHPITTESNSLAQLDALLAALDDLSREVCVLMTGSNPDPEGQAMVAAVRRFEETRPNVVFRNSLGPTLYYAALSYCEAVVGNSSSGLYEAPSFKKPTVNIGSRQKGRLRARSVVDCEPEASAIRAAIAEALRLDCNSVTNPYGDGRASERIVNTLTGISDFKSLLTKPMRHDPV
jgi:UDP-hydrolysing UDP-N-acetyl-D-glucosamine 2-epimerase